MPTGQNPGDSAQPLTVDSAAPAIEAILFPKEDKEPAPTATPEKAPAAPETPEVDESETADEPEATEDPEDEAGHEISDESETQDVEDETPQQPSKHKVKVDGQELEVTLDEALAGYSRTQDYTRKTQKHAENVKAFETEMNAVRAERQQIQAVLANAESQLAAVPEPDWDKLLAEDPQSFPLVHATWQRHQAKLAEVQQQRATVEQRMRADAEQQFKAYVAAESEKLHAAVPEWKDIEVAKKEKAAMLDYAHTLGFTDEQLNQIADHKAMVVLRKAMLFDAAEKAKADAALKAKPKLDKVKVAKPGSPAAKREVSEVTRRKQRLAKTGSIDDAASLIELMQF